MLDLQSVVVNRARIVRARPRFDSWSLEFVIQCIDERIDESRISDVLIEAGCYHGIGDFRPRYGRFTLESFEEAEG